MSSPSSTWRVVQRPSDQSISQHQHHSPSAVLSELRLYAGRTWWFGTKFTYRYAQGVNYSFAGRMSGSCQLASAPYRDLECIIHKELGDYPVLPAVHRSYSPWPERFSWIFVEVAGDSDHEGIDRS